MESNQGKDVCDPVTINKYLSYDSRTLESLKSEIERKEEEDVKIRVRDPIPEIQSLEFVGRKNFGLGLTYYKGELENDYSHAFRCFTASFEHGKWEAAFYLGELYYNGHGVEKDYAKAYNYYLLGAGK